MEISFRAAPSVVSLEPASACNILISDFRGYLVLDIPRSSGRAGLEPKAWLLLGGPGPCFCEIQYRSLGVSLITGFTGLPWTLCQNRTGLCGHGGQDDLNPEAAGLGLEF